LFQSGTGAIGIESIEACAHTPLTCREHRVWLYPGSPITSHNEGITGSLCLGAMVTVIFSSPASRSRSSVRNRRVGVVSDEQSLSFDSDPAARGFLCIGATRFVERILPPHQHTSGRDSRTHLAEPLLLLRIETASPLDGAEVCRVKPDTCKDRRQAGTVSLVQRPLPLGASSVPAFAWPARDTIQSRGMGHVAPGRSLARRGSGTTPVYLVGAGFRDSTSWARSAQKRGTEPDFRTKLLVFNLGQ